MSRLLAQLAEEPGYNCDELIAELKRDDVTIIQINIRSCNYHIINFTGVAADGTFDREIITRCMSHLETYEAVDIDTDALNHLKDMYSTAEYKVGYYTQ